MRYRPFGPSGAAVSAITLSVGADMLARGREAAMSLLFAALVGPAIVVMPLWLRVSRRLGKNVWSASQRMSRVSRR